MQRVLSFEQTPPLAVPFRFFLGAPMFAAAAGLLLAWYGPQALASRWSPATLALTHLLTLGFLAMCMLGALLQILPVVAGIDIPRAGRTASGVHALLSAGTVALVAAFLSSSPALFQTALPLLLAAFLWLFGAALRGIWRKCAPSPMLTAIRLALAALIVAVGLGATAASGFAWPLPLPLLHLTDLHAGWGLVGWVALLITGVAYQVVPMFQVTPVYPPLVTRWLASVLFLLLTAWTLASSSPVQVAVWTTALAGAIAVALVVFGATTLYLLAHRKRPKADVSTLFWRTGLLSLCAAVAVWACAAVAPAIGGSNAYPLLLGVLFVVGFASSIVSGMLYKIVPFLVWYHLQNNLAGVTKAPNVKQIVTDGNAVLQFRAHLLALVLLVAATIWPEQLARVAGLAFAASSTALGWNLLGAARVYRRISAAHTTTGLASA